MAASSSSSIIGVSSIYQTPSLELSRNNTTSTSTVVPSISMLISDKAHFGCGALKLKTSNNNNNNNNRRLFFDFPLRRSQLSSSFTSIVPSAIATPNNVLSEEAFRGLGGSFSNNNNQHASDDDSEAEDYYDSSSDDSQSQVVADDDDDDEELAVSNLNLPPPLVESLSKRGITHLFPIQVRAFHYPFNFYLFIYLFLS